LPQREGRASLPGLAAPAEVRFDGHGVPHVRARSAPDLSAALGWLHANDRMFQLEFLRRAGSGRLSELVGERTLDRDIEARVLQLRSAARRMWEVIEPESRALLEAYASGVNAWIASHDLPPDLRLFGVELEPWTPVDSLLTHFLLAYNLTFPRRYEERRFSWLVTLGAQRVRELLGKDIEIPPEIEAIARRERAKIPSTPGTQRIQRPRGSPWPARNAVQAGTGSNNWAVGPHRSVTGAPLVANDPHMYLVHPGIWYQVHLRAPDYEAAGMTLPGLPMVVIGQTAHLAWAFTNGEVDVTDQFFEELDESGRSVRRGEEWVPIRTEIQTIVVRGEEDVQLTVRSTDIGPLLEADVLGYAFSTDPGGGEGLPEDEPSLPPRSLAWTAYEPFDPIDIFRRLARATNAGEVEEAIEGFLCPVQNLVVGTRQGELLHTWMGRLPRRRHGDGYLPGLARNVDEHWDGFLPQSAGPRISNPEDGLLVTANSDTRPEESRRSVSGDFATPHRRDRIRSSLEARERWSVEDLAHLQLDNVSLYAREWCERLQRPLEEASEEAETARRVLAVWDGSMDLHGPAALFALFDQEMTEALSAVLHLHGQEGLRYPDRIPTLLRFARGELPPAWSDHVANGGIEGSPALLAGALERAWKRATEHFGDDPAAFDHGAMHGWTPDHPMNAIPLIGTFFRRGPFPVPGSDTTVAVFAGPWTHGRNGDSSIAVAYGAAMRWVADVAEPDNSRVILPIGQSAHPFDPHYDDQLLPFLKGETRAVAWSEEAIEASTSSRLRFEP